MSYWNPLLATDCYKLSHSLQLAPGTDRIYSYLCARSDKNFKEVVFFGLQYYLRKYMSQPITQEHADEFYTVYEKVLGRAVESELKQKIQSLVELGYWPLLIKAVPEGTVMPVKNVLMTITNTVDGFAWAVGYIESLLLKTWFSCTVATMSLEYRKVIEKAFAETGGAPESIPYFVHDFGLRGACSEESAAISGVAHLLSFKGSDTIPAFPCAMDYYDADINGLMMSVPASEHSVMCSYGRDNEFGAYERLLELYPSGIVSIVSDTFDIYHVLTNFLPRLKDRILTRDGKTVIRPDCYDDETEILTESGFKFFKDLKKFDLVAQYNEDASIEWVKPLKYYSEKYSGEMIRFNNFKNNIDLLVTPNHRMILRGRKLNNVKVQTAENVKFNFNWKHLVAGTISGNKELSWLERLKIAFQADGSYESHFKASSYEEGKHIVLRFNFTKKRKIKRLLWILKNGGFEHKVSIEPSRTYNTQIYVYLNTFVSKNFDWVNLRKIDGNWGRQFVEETKYWDGTIRTKHRMKFDTTNLSVAQKIQEVAAISGIRTKYTRFEDNRSEKFSDVHSLSVIYNRDYVDTQGIVKSTHSYSGKIHCVQVPSGMIIVRRKGQVAVCGNSGNPPDIICGDESAAPGSPENLGCLRLLDAEFGHKINARGMKVLNEKVGLIYGDGMYLKRYQDTLERMRQMGYAAENLVIGVGGILRNHSRDTLGFAIKATWIYRDGEGRAIEKDPVTDPGKRSHRGLLALAKDENGKFYTRSDVDVWTESGANYMDVKFHNGQLFNQENLSTLRGRIDSYIETHIEANQMNQAS